MKKNFKSLTQFIKEKLENDSVLDLTIKYQIEPNKIVCQAPNNYSEDQVIQYLQDLWFGQLPGGPENLDKIFGVNSKNLIDTYLEYKKFSHSSHKIFSKKLIEWDSSKDPDNEQDLEYFALSDLKYCMSFESFELKVKPGSDLKEILTDIFKSYESNAMNKYPVEIKLVDDSISFKNDNL